MTAAEDTTEVVREAPYSGLHNEKQGSNSLQEAWNTAGTMARSIKVTAQCKYD